MAPSVSPITSVAISDFGLWMARMTIQASAATPRVVKRAVPRSPAKVARSRWIDTKFPLPLQIGGGGQRWPPPWFIELLGAEVELLDPDKAEVGVGAAGLTAGQVTDRHLGGVGLLDTVDRDDLGRGVAVGVKGDGAEDALEAAGRGHGGADGLTEVVDLLGVLAGVDGLLDRGDLDVGRVVGGHRVGAVVVGAREGLLELGDDSGGGRDLARVSAGGGRRDAGGRVRTVVDALRGLDAVSAEGGPAAHTEGG